MKVFVTGASGFIGSAVVRDLIASGHEVLGLARSEAAAKKLADMGACIHYGDLNDLPSLKAGAEAADGIIHLGFIHDFTRFSEVCAIDKKAIETMGIALEGSSKPFLVTSGTAVVVKESGLVTEADRPVAGGNPRVASEMAVDELAAKGIRVAVVRLPPSVHGDSDTQGFVPILINLAREKGFAAITNDGENVWPAVHRLDAARLFVLALEQGFTGGTRYHAVAEQGIPFKDIAQAIAQKLQLPLTSLNTEDAAAHFTWFTHFSRFNNPTSSAHTRQVLNWTPSHPGLIEELEADVYFQPTEPITR